MKKEDSKHAFPTLFNSWLRDRGLKDTKPSELHFSDFFSWVEDNHREYTLFASSTPVSYDFEAWFDQETKQTWRN